MLSKARIAELTFEGIPFLGEPGVEFARSLAKQRDHLKRIKVVNSYYTNDTNCRISCSVGLALCESIGPDTEVDLELSTFEGAPDCHPLANIFSLRRNINRFALNNFLFDDNGEGVLSENSLVSLAAALQTNKSAAKVKLSHLGGNEALLTNVMAALVSSNVVEKIKLCDCQIYPAGVMAFSNTLKTCSNSALRTLTFSRCPFGDQGARALGLGLEGNKNLRNLNLIDCQVTDVGMRFLSDGILKSTLEYCCMQSNQFEFRCQESLKKLFHPTSPLQHMTMRSDISMSRQADRYRSSDLEVVFDLLDTNHTLSHLILPFEPAAILDHKERMSNLLQNNSCLKSINLLGGASFTEEQQKDMDEILLRSLLVNHSLTSTDLFGYDRYGDTPFQRLLDLNEKGVIAAAAGKGVPLPSGFVKELSDSAVPEALTKVGQKGGLTGMFSFLRQIHFGNLVAANNSLAETKKRPVEESSTT